MIDILMFFSIGIWLMGKGFAYKRKSQVEYDNLNLKKVYYKAWTQFRTFGLVLISISALGFILHFIKS